MKFDEMVEDGRMPKAKRIDARKVWDRRALDLAFDTPPEKVAALPSIVRQIVETQTQTKFDRSHLLSIADTRYRTKCDFGMIINWLVHPFEPQPAEVSQQPHA